MELSADIHETLKGLIIFDISGSEFCTDLKRVTTIITPRNITEYYSKMIGHKKSFIYYGDWKYDLIDFRRIMAMDEKPLTQSSRIILVQFYNKRVAFLVDKVIDLITMDQIFIEKSLELIPYCSKNYVGSILKFQGRTIYMPDYEKISKELNDLKSETLEYFADSFYK